MRRTALVLVLVMICAACGGTADPAGPTPTTRPGDPTAGPEILKANLPRELATDVTVDEITRLVASNTAFAFDLFRALSTDENLILSPYSIASALTMTLAGARGNTASEIVETLHLGDLEDRVHSARNALDVRITTPPRQVGEDQRDPFTIQVANSLWGQAGYPFLDEFLALLAANYDAGMNLVDFVDAAEQARVQVNDWVEDQTEGRIFDLIPESAVDDATRLVLVNAIWFKANWYHQFDPELTADDTFTLLDGSTVTVPLMNQSVRTGYFSGEGYQAAHLPYVGDAAMLVILPDEGRFDQIAESLDSGELDRIRQNWGDYQLELTFPKFEFSNDFSINDTFKELGVVDAFIDPRTSQDGADFTGMTSVRELFITDTFHQAFIAVDEEGTEASAATAMIGGVTSMPLPGTLRVDRPFIFLIEHTGTGEILFMGQVVDPR